VSDLNANPCPFCGSNNIHSDCYSTAFSVSITADDCFYYCKDCDAQGPAASDMEEAHRRWNGRGQKSAPVAGGTRDTETEQIRTPP
jgi:Lar family restriction alleviation protein